MKLTTCGRLAAVMCVFVARTAFAQNAPVEAVYSEPLPRNWTVPVYPPEALKAGAEGKVFIEFVVDAEGHIVDPQVRENKKKPVDPRLNEAVLGAAKQWTFSPASNAGKPEPRAVGVVVGFYLKGRGGKPSVDLPQTVEVASTKPAKPLLQGDPVYPDELLPRKLPGALEFEFQVSAAGKPENIQLVYASDAAFVTAGLECVKSWTFEPGHQGPLAVATPKKSPMEFYVEGERVSPEDLLAANGISGFSTELADKAPVPLALYAPVPPRERLMAFESGEAEVEFVIRENGQTDFVTPVSSSQPEFGASLAAAVAMWRFKPAYRDGQRTTVKLHSHWYFTAKGNEADARLVAALKAGGIGSAKGLDRPLTPVWRIAPGYPTGLRAEKPAGEAVIELIIDRTGRARLPQVVSASREEFGWAAMAALSQWVFEPPTRGGGPVDVRVNVPVSFPAPVE